MMDFQKIKKEYPLKLGQHKCFYVDKPYELSRYNPITTPEILVDIMDRLPFHQCNFFFKEQLNSC